jgi:hypothetical protein
MKNLLHLSFLSIFIVSTFLSCTSVYKPNLILDDIKLLKKGMTHNQVEEILGKPEKRIVGSSAFTSDIYKLVTNETVYLGFLEQSDYLDSAYYFSITDDSNNPKYIIPDSLDLPSEVNRTLTLEDFEELEAGIDYFSNVYTQVGPPNDLIIFEGGRSSLIYYLSDGGRIGLNSESGVACISRIGYSPKSFGDDWRVLSEDTEGICKGK